jgi:hypothetical protein
MAAAEHRAALEAVATGTGKRPRGNAVLPAEHAAASALALACRDLVDATLRDSDLVYENDEHAAMLAASGHVPAPSEALPPLP